MSKVSSPQRKQRNQKHSHTLVIVICLLLLFGFISTSFISYFLANKAMHKRIQTDSLPLTSDNIYSHVQRDLIRPVLISSVMSKDTFVRDWVLDGEKNSQQIISYLSEIQQQYNTITSFFISDQTQRYYHSSGVLKTINRQNPEDNWYYDSIKTSNPFDINMDVDTAAPDRTTFFVNHKIYDYNNHAIGIIGVGLASDIIRQRINSYQEAFGRTIYFVNKKGEVTLHGVNFPKQMSLHQMKGMHAISEQFTKNPIGSFKYHNGEHEVFVNTRLVNDLDWYIVIEESDTEQPEMLRALWLNLLLSLVVTLAIGWLIHHLIQRHQSQLRLLLTNDHLTGLATRQGFEPIFQQMLKTAQRNKTPLSILLIDLDHFKKINDRMGHLEGDAVLKSVANILEKNVRKCDTVSRWGGEEFIIALTDCNAESAFMLAEKIRKQIASEISTKDNDKRITASIGVAEFDLIEQGDALFARADTALYLAKKNGRNQVVSASDAIKT